MVLGGDNPEHREPFESFVKEYLQTGKNIIRMGNQMVTSEIRK